MSALEDDARSYLSRQLGGIDVSEVPFEAVKSCVEKSYEGGWVAFEADFHRVMSITEKPKLPPTPFQLWAKLSRIMTWEPRTTFILRPHQEVVSVDMTDDEVKAVLRIARTEERATRDRVTYGARLIVWKRDADGDWGRSQSIDVWTEEAEEMVRWGRVRTPEYVASQREQFDTCFRPGTHKSPMQGPAARLEITREELHGIEKENH